MPNFTRQRDAIYPLGNFSSSFVTRLTAFLLLLGSVFQAQAQTPDSLSGDLSLDSLLNIRIASASKYEQLLSEVPASVTLLTSDDIRDHGFNDLLEALQAIRSIYLSNDRNYAYIGVRGFSRPTDYTNKVLVMIDGVPINDNIWGAANVASDYLTVNMDQVERIELIRGASSSLYGSYAMLGVINVVMKDGQTLDGGKASFTAGSFGRKQFAGSWGTRTAGGLDISIGTQIAITQGQTHYYPEFDTCATCTGIADHLDDGKYIGVSAKLKFKAIEAKAFYTERNTGVPTASYGTLFGDNRMRVHDRQMFADVIYTKEIDQTKVLTLKTYVQEVYYAESYPYDPADGGLGHDHSDGIWTGSEARFRWDVLSNNRLFAGAEWQQHYRAEFHSQDETSVYTNANYPYFGYSFYLQDEYQPVKWLALTAGGRFDRNFGGKKAVTPRFSALVNPLPKSTLKLIWGRAFRAPNISELLLQDGFSYIGNPDLTPEFITTGEVSWEQRIGKQFFATGTVYRYHMADLVDKVLRPTDSLDSYGNVGNVLAQGAEAEVVARGSHGNRIFLSGTFQKVINQRTDSLESNSPCFIVKVGGTVNFLRHFSLSTLGVLEDRRLTVYDTWTNSFLLWNGNLSFHPAWQGESGVRKALSHATISFRINNILNTEYYTPGGFEHLQPAIRQNGRNFAFKLSWNI
jgi:iron complex outermembrane receptor protein